MTEPSVVVTDQSAAATEVVPPVEATAENTPVVSVENKLTAANVTLVSKPKIDLSVHMGRQNAEFYTQPDWPDVNTLQKKITYVLRREGLYEIRKNDVGVFIIRRDKFDKPLPGFPKGEQSEGFVLNFGKIPTELFTEILSFFKDICDESKDEVYIQTFWDPESKKYFNHVPKQRVSGASVNYERDQELEKRCVLVLETHSHNTMGAFFSGIDNADEKSDRFFGVIGELNKTVPAMKFSFVCGGKRVEIQPEGIFHSPPVRDFSDWKGNITRGSITSSSSYGNYQGTGIQRSGWQAYEDDAFEGYSGRREYTPEHSALWGSERLGQTQQTPEKEAYEAVEQAAKEVGSEIEKERGNNKGLTVVPKATGEVKPYFQQPSKKNTSEGSTFSEQAQKVLFETITDFKHKGAHMSDFEKEKAFGRLLESLSDEDVIVLSKVMVDFGNQPAMLDALGIDMVINEENPTSSDSTPG